MLPQQTANGGQPGHDQRAPGPERDPDLDGERRANVDGSGANPSNEEQLIERLMQRLGQMGVFERPAGAAAASLTQRERERARTQRASNGRWRLGPALGRDLELVSRSR